MSIFKRKRRDSDNNVDIRLWDENYNYIGRLLDDPSVRIQSLSHMYTVNT